MTRQHSDFAPSGAERWTRCPYSVPASRGREDRETEHSARGTAAHVLLNWCLTEERVARERVGQEVYRTELPGAPGVPLVVLVTEEMAAWVQTVVDYVNALPGDRRLRWYEQPVDFSDWVPDGYGTTDALVVAPRAVLHVVDAKFGTGHRVDAAGQDGQGNRQLLLYALGALDELEGIVDVEDVLLHIAQPSLDHVSEWVVTAAEVRAFGERAREAALLALSDNPPAHPAEETCRWCPARAECEPLAEHVRAALALDFEAEPVVEAAALVPEALGARLDALGLYEVWARALREEGAARLLQGQEVPGWKMVEGRTQRRWTDPDELVRYLTADLGLAREEVTETRPLGVPAIEKTVGKAKWKVVEKRFVFRPPGKPTLAPARDPRPTYSGSATSEDFENGNETDLGA